MKCYKVVRKYAREKYVSCRMFESAYSKLYSIDRWTIADPDTMGICTFDTVENAQAFIRATAHLQLSDIIFLAEGEHRRYSRLICDYGDLADFYKQRKNKHRLPGSTEPPQGTLFFERVMLLEQIRR